MRIGKLLVLSASLLSVVALPLRVAASELYTLEFLPTQNAPAEAQGTMTLKVVNGETVVHFRVRGAAPNTIYTIWTVFNVLLGPPFPTSGHDVPSCSAAGLDTKAACTQLVGGTAWTGRPGFPKEGNGVAPLARLDHAFTSGMGLDPGAVFFTSDRGDGEVQVKLDYDLVRAAPLGNRDIIVQCVPGPLADNGKTCQAPSQSVRVTSTWLRTFVAQVVAAGLNPATECANYDPAFEPAVGFWQCIDPATVDPRTGNGLPKVPRFSFDHFRLAAHPDALTHGFIGGDPKDHRIDMVGRYADLMPKP